MKILKRLLFVALIFPVFFLVFTSGTIASIMDIVIWLFTGKDSRYFESVTDIMERFFLWEGK